MELIELSSLGDSSLDWNPDNPNETEVARTAFNAYKAKGMHIFHVDDDGEKSTRRMETFDASAGALVAVTQLKGG